MLDAQTKSRIDSARDILVGKVLDPKSQVEQITIARQVAGLIREHKTSLALDHLLAAEDPGAFKEQADEIIRLLATSDSWPGGTNPRLGVDTRQGLLSLWRNLRGRLLSRLESLSPDGRLPWYGPNMSARSFATARLMGPRPHSQDVFDTLRKRRPLTSRLRHAAHICVTTFGWSFFC